MAKALQLKEFGDYACGRVVDSEMHLTRPARTVAGTVCGVFMLDPKHVRVQVGTGETVTIRVTS